MTAHSIDDIRSDIEETKSHIQSTLDEIDGRRQELKDWRTAVRSYPLVSVGLAVALGVLFSGGLVKAIKPPRGAVNQLLWSSISAMLMRRSGTQNARPKLSFR